MRAHALRLIAVAAFVLAGFACSKDESAPADSGNNGFGPSDPSGSSSGSSSGSPNNPANAPFVTVSNETMEFDGKTRSYILAKPENYDANKSYPLVLSFHGNPGDAKGMANGLPFDSVSKSDAVIAYPQGDNDNWDLYTPTDGNADMGFIKALPDEIKTKLNIDASKVFGFGYSGGAFFLTQFTCRFGGFFRAISINSGGGPDEAQMGYGKYPNGCYQCPGGPDRHARHARRLRHRSGARQR